MRIGIVAPGTETLIRECPGPLPGGDCSLARSGSGARPCAGSELLVRLRVVGRPRSWLFRVATDIEECPVYRLDESIGRTA